MPIYEYGCSRCGHVEEALQRMSDPPLLDCPRCAPEHTGTLEKLFSAHVVGRGTPSRTPGRPPPSCHGCHGAGSCPMAE